MTAFYTNQQCRQRDQMRRGLDGPLWAVDWPRKLSQANSMQADSDAFEKLDATGRGIAAVAARPRWPVYLALGLALAIAWVLLASMAAELARSRPPGLAGPGDALLRHFPDSAALTVVRQFVSLCLAPAKLDVSAGAAFGALASMWMLMSIAMMLPSAAPLIRTYCEIADTAAGKGERVVHPLVLVAGYLCVWLMASLGFAALTLLVQRLGNGALAPAPDRVAGIALLAAGAYQFSHLKHACLEKCRNPFGTLFARWTTSTRGIFRLGLQQGVWCLGCCWALMLIMFAVGVMNIFWMALIGVFTLFEKEMSGRLASRVGGAILLVWGAALLVVSF